jgi:hypothetical protein
MRGEQGINTPPQGASLRMRRSGRGALVQLNSGAWWEQRFGARTVRMHGWFEVSPGAASWLQSIFAESSNCVASWTLTSAAWR